LVENTSLIQLYSEKILKFATEMPHTESLTNPDASILRRSPVCGSTVNISIKISHGMLSEYSQDVKACALGQAAASIVGNSIIGCTSNQVRDARDQLLAMLTNKGPSPEKPFQDLEILSPAKDYKNRHSSIMLTLEALVEALETIPG
jgi:NifU-like protein involved in Fe-S cluster formation|tara:strand:- start:1498 stop:1938 length:441 start_codon:yes stop_codon:yes gene_type:complete